MRFLILASFFCATCVCFGASPASLSQPSQGGDGVGNGGGLSEQNTMLAWQTLPTLAEQCVSLGTKCLPDSQDLALLLLVSVSLKLQYAHEGSILFVAGSQNTGLFEDDRDGERYLFTTRPTPGQAIQVDTERLTHVDTTGAVTYVASLSDAVFDLSRVVAYAVMQGDETPGARASRARLASALQALAQTQTRLVRAETAGASEITLLVLSSNPAAQNPTPLLLLADSSTQYSIAERLANSLACDDPHARLVLRQIENLFWYQIPERDAQGHLILTVQGQVHWACVSNDHSSRWKAKVEISCGFAGQPGDLAWLKGSDQYFLSAVQSEE